MNLHKNIGNKRSGNKCSSLCTKWVGGSSDEAGRRSVTPCARAPARSGEGAPAGEDLSIEIMDFETLLAAAIKDADLEDEDEAALSARARAMGRGESVLVARSRRLGLAARKRGGAPPGNGGSAVITR